MMEGPPYKKRREEWISIIFCLQKFHIHKDLIRRICQCVALDFSKYHRSHSGHVLVKNYCGPLSLEWILIDTRGIYRVLHTCSKCYGPFRGRERCEWCHHKEYITEFVYEDFIQRNIRIF
jgi:hypothetical protein